jgi:hypothetical protein
LRNKFVYCADVKKISDQGVTSFHFEGSFCIYNRDILFKELQISRNFKNFEKPRPTAGSAPSSALECRAFKP